MASFMIRREYNEVNVQARWHRIQKLGKETATKGMQLKILAGEAIGLLDGGGFGRAVEL